MSDNDLYFVPDEVNTLLCPRCRKTYHNWDTLEVFLRENDRTDCGLHATFSAKQNTMVPIDRNVEGSPSHRGGGVELRLVCESCGYIFKFWLRWHKGQIELGSAYAS